MKQTKTSLQLPKPTRNTRKIANKLMTVASGKKAFIVFAACVAAGRVTKSAVFSV